MSLFRKILQKDKKPLTFIANNVASTIKLKVFGNLSISELKYRTNNNPNWTTYNIDTVISLNNQNDYVQFMNTENNLSTSYYDYVNFVMTGSINASGNIQSMLNYSQSCSKYCFCGLFQNCDSLISAPQLPATNLNLYCYHRMFHNCISLIEAPKLPAIDLNDCCYLGMFEGCNSLISAPQLPATNLYIGCYYNMFLNCTSLNYIKVNFTNWNNDSSSTLNWLNYVSPSGTFVKPNQLQQIRGVSNIPENWIIQNIS